MTCHVVRRLAPLSHTLNGTKETPYTIQRRHVSRRRPQSVVNRGRMWVITSNMGAVVEHRTSLRRTPATTRRGRPCLCLLLVYLLWAILAQSSAHNISSVTAAVAVLSYSYTDSSSGDMTHNQAHGAYGHGSLVRNTSGVVTHVRVVNDTHHGCTTYVNTPLTHHTEPWVALVQRGQCTFQLKIDMAIFHNATAIVIYNKQEPKNGGVPEIEVMNHAPTMLTAVLIDFVDGEKLVELVDSGVSVYMDIAVGKFITPYPQKPAPPKKHTTAVLLAFVGFLILGLIVVVVYAVRHAKYVHSRNQSNLSITLRQADGRQGQEALLNNVSTHPGHPPPLRTDGPSLIHQPLQVQALLPQIQEEDEQQPQQQQQQNHQQLDLGDQSLDQTQHSPLLPH